MLSNEQSMPPETAVTDLLHEVLQITQQSVSNLASQGTWTMHVEQQNLYPQYTQHPSHAWTERTPGLSATHFGDTCIIRPSVFYLGFTM